MRRNIGYPLPDGDAFEEEIACTFVFYPDREEYRRALLGSLQYFTTWIAWEKDEDKRGKDAARAWKLANELTLECWNMGCFEQLTDDVTNILLLLQNKKDCCDDNITYGPSTEVETEIVPDVGDPPDFYGETEITDWDDWRSHVCYNAYVWVDELIRQANTIGTALSIGGIVLGLVAAALVLLSYVATGGFIYQPDVMLIAKALILSGTDSMFSQAADDLWDAREAIVCAIVSGDSVAEAVEDALTIPLTWTLFFQHADYDSATAILYEGGQGENYLSTETSEACFDCDEGEGLSDEDVWIQLYKGEFVSYNASQKIWTYTSEYYSICDRIDLFFWENELELVLKEVRMKVLTCDGAGTCGGHKHHRGFSYPGPTLTYELDHPDLPDLADPEIEYVVGVHAAPFTMSFKLYNPA